MLGALAGRAFGPGSPKIAAEDHTDARTNLTSLWTGGREPFGVATPSGASMTVVMSYGLNVLESDCIAKVAAVDSQ